MFFYHVFIHEFILYCEVKIKRDGMLYCIGPIHSILLFAFSFGHITGPDLGRGAGGRAPSSPKICYIFNKKMAATRGVPPPPLWVPPLKSNPESIPVS